MIRKFSVCILDFNVFVKNKSGYVGHSEKGKKRLHERIKQCTGKLVVSISLFRYSVATA